MTMIKLQRSTWALCGTAVVLLGVVVATELSRSRSDAPPTPLTQGDPLFQVEEADIQAFQVELAEDRFAFRRLEDGTWELTKPLTKPANEGTIAFLLNLIATGNRQSPQTVPVAELAEFGLDNPLATVTFTTADGTTSKLAIGDPNFDGSQRYAIAQPNVAADQPLIPATGEVDIGLVPNTLATAANRPLADWEGLAPLQPEATEPAPDAETTSEAEESAPVESDEESDEASAEEPAPE